MTAMPPILVNAATLAQFLDISGRHITTLWHSGAVVRVKPGAYDLKASVRGYEPAARHHQ